MIRMSLTRNKYTIINDIDADLAELKWHCDDKGYARRRQHGNGKMLFLHRVILQRMTDFPLSRRHETDHINRNPLDNRRENLRVASRTENCRNRCKQKNNRSGYIGVSFKKVLRKWQVHITIDKKRKHLGYFSTAVEAARVYNEAAKKYFGDFAVINELS